MLRILLTLWPRQLQSTPMSLPAWRAATVVMEIYSLMGMVAGVTANLGPYCNKDFSSGVSSYLERLITHLSWILEEIVEVKVVLKVLVVLEAILEVDEEAQEMRCLSFFIWVFLYCRNVFSLLFKMAFCKFVKVGLSSFCGRDVLVCTISVRRWLILMCVHSIPLWMSEHKVFFIIAYSSLCSHLSNFKTTEPLDLHLQRNT